jgi:hypothetical protein
MSINPLHNDIMTPPSTLIKPKRREFDTPTRARFISNFFNRKKGESVHLIAHSDGLSIPSPTARRWIKQYQIQGSPAMRRSRKLSKRLGRPKSLDVKQLEPLLSPSHPSHNLK